MSVLSIKSSGEWIDLVSWYDYFNFVKLHLTRDGRYVISYDMINKKYIIFDVFNKSYIIDNYDFNFKDFFYSDDLSVFCYTTIVSNNLYLRIRINGVYYDRLVESNRQYDVGGTIFGSSDCRVLWCIGERATYYSTNYGVTWVEKLSIAESFGSTYSGKDGNKLIINGHHTLNGFNSYRPLQRFGPYGMSENGKNIIVGTSTFYNNIYVSYDYGYTFSALTNKVGTTSIFYLGYITDNGVIVLGCTGNDDITYYIDGVWYNKKNSNYILSYAGVNNVIAFSSQYKLHILKLT